MIKKDFKQKYFLYCKDCTADLVVRFLAQKIKKQKKTIIITEIVAQ